MTKEYIDKYAIVYTGDKFIIYKLDTNDEGFRYIDYTDDSLIILETNDPLKAISKIYELEEEYYND